MPNHHDILPYLYTLLRLRPETHVIADRSEGGIVTVKIDPVAARPLLGLLFTDVSAVVLDSEMSRFQERWDTGGSRSGPRDSV